MDYNGFNYQNNEENIRKIKRNSTWKGVFIGGGVVLAVAAFFIGCLLAILINMRMFNYNGEFALGSDSINKMNELINYVDEHYLYEVDKEAMEDAIYEAIFNSLGDPYSTYYTEDEYKELMESTTGTYSGIGVVVQEDVESGYILVVEPYENGPAYEAGLRPGDLIVAIEGEDIKDLDINLAVKKIKGEEGTSVNVTVRRDGKDFDSSITRKVIEIINVDYEMLNDEVGYIAIASFEGAVAKQFEAAYKELETQGMKSLVIDVRSNPGGLMTAVVDILDMFLEEGDMIVYTLDSNGNRVDHVAKKGVTIDIPCTVLINEHSASASEIFAGALQDHDKAEIIGTQSFGKGIVQSVVGLEDGSAFKITIEDYYTPDGHNIHGKGITPDQVVEYDPEVYEEEEIDTQIQAGVDFLTQ